MSFTLRMTRSFLPPKHHFLRRGALVLGCLCSLYTACMGTCMPWQRGFAVLCGAPGLVGVASDALKQSNHTPRATVRRRYALYQKVAITRLLTYEHDHIVLPQAYSFRGPESSAAVRPVTGPPSWFNYRMWGSLVNQPLPLFSSAHEVIHPTSEVLGTCCAYPPATSPPPTL
jgi:hypothetical protein